METSACPRCGGVANRLLAPGFYECTSSVLTDVVPPNQYANPSAIPLTRTCGHHFQVGTGQPAAAQCSCGMFAVGTCHQCGEPRCGQHGSLAGGVKFLCNSHIQNANHRRNLKEYQRDAERKRQAEQVAREAEEQRRQMVAAQQKALPELPAEGGASAAQLSAGLAELVPDRARSFVVERRSLGRSRRVRGWAFPLETRKPNFETRHTYYRHRGVIVTNDGRAFIVQTESPSRTWTPGDHTHGPPHSETSGLSPADTAAILGQVRKWLGRGPGEGTTPARTAHLEMLVREGRLSQEEASRLAPSGAVSDEAWAAIRDR